MQSTARMTNVGKSPAVDVFGRAAGVTKPAGYVLKLSDIVYDAAAHWKRAMTLFPTQHYPLTDTFDWSNDPPGTLNDRRKIYIAALQARTLVQYFWGEVRYRDAFGVQHWTHYCTMISGDLNTGTPCDIYNETDQNPEIEEENETPPLPPTGLVGEVVPCPAP